MKLQYSYGIHSYGSDIHNIESIDEIIVELILGINKKKSAIHIKGFQKLKELNTVHTAHIDYMAILEA